VFGWFDGRSAVGGGGEEIVLFAGKIWSVSKRIMSLYEATSVRHGIPY
jgi:hypothetical protein